MDTKRKLKGSCHCRAVEFEVQLTNGFEVLSRCNCSICARRGAIVTPLPIDCLQILKGKENLSLYQFNTNTAEHYFCSTCGIYTHHRMRSNPNMYSINIACLDGVNPFDFRKIETADGINHSCDRK